MNKFNIVSFWGDETNPFANPDLCNNGGGYYQPCGGAVYNVNGVGDIVVEYSDTSCGDFGARWDAVIKAPTGRAWCVSIDHVSVMTDMDMEEEEYQNRRAIRQASRALGFDAWELIDCTREAVDLAAYGNLKSQSDIIEA